MITLNSFPSRGILGMFTRFIFPTTGEGGNNLPPRGYDKSSSRSKATFYGKGDLLHEVKGDTLEGY